MTGTGIEAIVIAAAVKGGASSVAKIVTGTLLEGGGWLTKTLPRSRISNLLVLKD